MSCYVSIYCAMCAKRKSLLLHTLFYQLCGEIPTQPNQWGFTLHFTTSTTPSPQGSRRLDYIPALVALVS